MSSVPLNNVLLPAVVISSAVFSTLTLPFALIRSEPIIVEFPPLFSGEIQPIFNGKHKEVAIPYVGFAIVVSVGAGIACVEVNRRWQAYREALEAEEQARNFQQQNQEPLSEALKLAEYRPEASEIDLLPKGETAIATTGAQTISVEATEQVVNAPQQPTTDKFFPGSALQELELAFNKLLVSREQYQTSRIKVPHLERRLFVLQFQDEYYSFFRAEKTKDKVLEVMAKLDHRVEKTVITQTEKGYAIWAKEPDVSSQQAVAQPDKHLENEVGEAEETGEKG